MQRPPFTVLVALAVLLAAPIILHAAAKPRAESNDGPMAFWRTFFARPTELVSPPSNPTTAAKIALGKKLFRDTRLSGDSTRSCATCHNAETGFSDGGVAAGRKIDGMSARDTPTLWNIGWAKRLFWDGRAATLEAQALQPIGADHELAGRWPEILARLHSDNKTTNSFAAAFPGSAKYTTANVVDALAAYQRSLVSPLTRFDRWIAGDHAALSNTERNGFYLFVGKAGCVGCHAGWRFTDDSLYDIGLPHNTGTGGITKPLRMKTPTLRMLATTAPYMHDGRIAGLDEIVAHYSGGSVKRPGVSEKMPHGLVLNPIERSELVSFLNSLSN